MATGQRAFSGETAIVLHDAILNQTPVSVHDLNSALPSEFVANIDKCLQKERGARYQSAAEVRDALEQVRHDTGLHRRTAPPNPAVRPASSGTTLGRKLIFAMAAIALVIGAWFAMMDFAQPKVATVTNIVRLTNDPKAKVPINGVVTDGVRLYFIERMPWGSGSGIAQVALVGGETTLITTTLKDVLAILDISPDKSKLLVTCQGGFWVQPIPGGTPYPLGTSWPQLRAGCPTEPTLSTRISRRY
jgi:hypothetical protein